MSIAYIAVVDDDFVGVAKSEPEIVRLVIEKTKDTPANRSVATHKVAELTAQVKEDDDTVRFFDEYGTYDQDVNTESTNDVTFDIDSKHVRVIGFINDTDYYTLLLKKGIDGYVLAKYSQVEDGEHSDDVVEGITEAKLFADVLTVTQMVNIAQRADGLSGSASQDGVDIYRIQEELR